MLRLLVLNLCTCYRNAAIEIGVKKEDRMCVCSRKATCHAHPHAHRVQVPAATPSVFNMARSVMSYIVTCSI